MNAPTPAVATLQQIVTTLKQRWWLVAAPLVACTLFAVVYALVKPKTWEATQTLQVRDQASGKDKRLGSFDDADSMKTAQETILEISKSQQVVSSALQKAGPSKSRKETGPFPAGEEVDDLRKAIRLSPPKGAELGRTEILYLAVKDHDRERAIALTTAVCDELEVRLQELRNTKARSIIAELEKTLRLAQTDLESATERLEEMERDVGRDLGELRVLNEAGAGESNLRSALNQIKSELRQADTVRSANAELLRFLVAAGKDPGEIVAAPNRLLESQPALKRLKEGLVDAQLRTAQLSASMSDEHPKVQASRLGEQLVQRDLHKELEIAIRSVNTDVNVNESQIESLEAQSADVTERLDRLAGLRARYANLVADVKQRNEILEKAKKELADARASEAAATSVSLLSRLDTPQTGNYPLGPGRTTIVLGGALGGLLMGVGLVFLVTPLGNFRGRRFSDYLGFGRRASDLKRASDGRPRAEAAGVAAVSRRSEDRSAEPLRENRRAESTADCVSVGNSNFEAMAPSVVSEPVNFAAFFPSVIVAVQDLPELIDPPATQEEQTPEPIAMPAELPPVSPVVMINPSAIKLVAAPLRTQVLTLPGAPATAESRGTAVMRHAPLSLAESLGRLNAQSVAST